MKFYQTLRKEKTMIWDKLNKEQYNACIEKLQIEKNEFDKKIRSKKSEFSIYVQEYNKIIFAFNGIIISLC